MLMEQWRRTLFSELKQTFATVKMVITVMMLVTALSLQELSDATLMIITATPATTAT
jgi:hypothetical protein